MFRLVNVLLSFIESLSRDQTKCLFLNDEPCMVRSSIIDESFLFSLNKCTGSCNVLSPKMCVPKETKNINVNAFNIITYKN